MEYESYLCDALNDFRRDNGIYSADFQSWISEGCFEHCKSMAALNMLYHCPQELRWDLFECVSCCDIFLNDRDQIRHSIFQLLGNSPSHRNLILSASILGAAFLKFDNKMFVTVRGE